MHLTSFVANHFLRSLCAFNLIASCFLASPVRAAVVIDDGDPRFYKAVSDEVLQMRDGKRGLACQVLIERLDQAAATTTIKPLTDDEATWHPNDTKGTRTHVVALDTKVRGAERSAPTSAILYLNVNRVNPALSVYKLGTFVAELANAVDLNLGQYAGDSARQKKRSTFFRNAWCDALGFNLVEIMDRIPTKEYQQAKQKGLLLPKYAKNFPIMDPDVVLGEEIDEETEADPSKKTTP